MHRILKANDHSIKIGSESFMTGTYTELDLDNKMSIVANVSSDLRIKLTSTQELWIYDRKQKEVAGNSQVNSISVKQFIDSLPELSEGSFAINTQNQVIVILTI